MERAGGVREERVALVLDGNILFITIVIAGSRSKAHHIVEVSFRP